MNTRLWFRQMWSKSGRALAADYATIGAQHPHFLADIALRGYVWVPIPDNDPVAAARLEGRRQLALETIKLCNMHPDQLFQLLDPLPKGEPK